jgi:hypothetical protein
MNQPAYRWAAMACLLAGCAGNPASSLPPTLQVPPGQKLVLDVTGRGVQIYACKADEADASHFQWTLVAPEATLYDDAGNELGRHYAGPTWELTGGSHVHAEVKARADAPKPDAIPWLLLAAPPEIGTGLLAGVVSVQRFDTIGGKAPASGCDAAHADAALRVPYQARYRFYTAAP